MDGIPGENHARPSLDASNKTSTPMKQIFKPFKIAAALALLALGAGCATTSTTTTQTTDILTAAGFKLVMADTPEKQELLKSLPAGRLSL
jgi:hypothetical protein